MSYKDGNWNSRVGALGDQAEAKFEAVWEKGFVRTGLNRPPLQMYKLPMQERYRPDYLTTEAYVEVQGFGKGQTMALKSEKLGALRWWEAIHPVKIFCYDSFNDRYALVTLADIDWMIDTGRCSLKVFPEGKPYWAIPARLIFERSE